MPAVLHIEPGKTGSAEGMATVDHYPRNVDGGVIVKLAQLTFVLVQQFVHEFVDLVSIEIRRVFSLLEEKGGGVFKFFHLIQKI